MRTDIQSMMVTDDPTRLSEPPRPVTDDELKSLTTAAAFYSLLDSIDSESIGTGFELDRHSKKHDFTEHVKIVIYEGLEVSDSFKSLAQKTETHADFELISGSHFSRLTNDRAVVAVVALLSELLHTPQLYHQRGCARKRLERLEDQIVAIDASHLSLATTLIVPSVFQEIDEADELRPEGAGFNLLLATRIDGEMLADTAVVKGILTGTYEFSSLDEPANVLVFPNPKAGNISYKLLQRRRSPAGLSVQSPVGDGAANERSRARPRGRRMGRIPRLVEGFDEFDAVSVRILDERGPCARGGLIGRILDRGGVDSVERHVDVLDFHRQVIPRRPLFEFHGSFRFGEL